MHVIIHGHFYQPPRENPWSGHVPRQESAHPAHDWNERITDECYRPNARSRVLGENNRIEEIVNNYAHLSFDFGPTLLSWLEAMAPNVYQQIIEGDRLSQRLQDGHGNAIAHVYNHVIMPLANYRDKGTQIIWGLRDFEWRFGRKSESIWLGETAVNLETIKLLIEHGIRYLILSPFQALRTRPLDRSRGWTDAARGKIDPRRAYRYFLKDPRRRRIRNRSIDIFFYDGPLAADVSFNHLLRSASGFADRLQQLGGAGMVNVATDGEVYGHHEPFADMCLSYTIRREAVRRGFEFTNYGRYLDLYPPEAEVDLNFGEHDEGTAWSCAHGVGRWERDCGCSTGGREGWNQRWRTPLRRGFDIVRDRLVEAFLQEASPLVQDPWATRDDYILVMLDPRPSTREAFFDQHARNGLSNADRRKLLCLLESQRYAMYMYTSCGWFFADISGIETVQNMAYARRAIELAKPWLHLDVERMLLEYLGEAESNVPAMGTGADVYQRFVNPQCIGPARVAGGLALEAAVLGEGPAPRQFRYEARGVRFECVSNEHATCHGRIELTHRDTTERFGYEVHVYGDGPGEIRAYVLPVGEGAGDRFPGTPAEAEVKAASAVELYALRDLVAEDREAVIRAAYESILEKQDHLLTKLFEEGRDLMTTCREARIAPPPVLLATAGHVISRLLSEKAGELEAHLLARLEPDREEEGSLGEMGALLADITDLLDFSRGHNLEVTTHALVQAYGRALTLLLKKLIRRPEPHWAEQFVEVIQSSYQLHFPLDRRPLEDLAFLVLGKHRETLASHRDGDDAEDERSWRAFEALAGALNLNIGWILEQTNGSGPALHPGQARSPRSAGRNREPER